MLPAFALKPAHKRGACRRDADYLHLPAERQSVSRNVLIYAACSASFFAWLTGSPFILHDMGYSPAAIGLSYVPQTIAFWWAGTAAARRCKMGRSADATMAAGALCAERHRYRAVGFIPGAGRLKF